MNDQFIDDLYSAMDASRASASAALVEDALMEITSLHGKPYTRQRLLLLLALDDIQAANTDPTIKDRLGRLKDALEGFVYVEKDPRRDHFCIAAQEEMDAAVDDGEVLPTYNALLPVHLDMVEQEEKEERALEEAIEKAKAEAIERERLAKEEAERQAKEEAEKVVKQREEARLARLRRFASSS